MSSAITTATTTSTTKSLLRLKHWLCGWRKQWDEGGTWFKSGVVVSLCWNVSGNPRWQIGPQIRYLAAVAFKIRKSINLMAESAEVSVRDVDCTDSISLHNKLSVFLFIGTFWMQSFQFTNGPNLLSHYICLCPFHEEISMELCFEKQEDQDMKYQWSKCHCLDIKTSFQGLPKFNFKPAMVERNPILLTNLIPFERSLLPQGLLYLE